MQSTDMKVAPSTSNITTGTCSSKVASVHIYCVDNNYKEPSIDLETHTKSNKNLDKTENQQNKNTTEKLYSDNINEKSKKRRVPSREQQQKEENKKDDENKRHKHDKKTKSGENDVPTEKQKIVYILGDSIIKKLNGYLLKFLVRV